MIMVGEIFYRDFFLGMVGTEAEVEVNLDAGVGDAIEQARNVVGILMMTSDCQFKTVKDYVIDLTW